MIQSIANQSIITDSGRHFYYLGAAGLQGLVLLAL